ncbi:MAG: hypothetical protein AVDCRST_MAG75-530 [uncultured Propionibacteriaceae bacterium]|uniref:Uncharacterized protein n=1 Tax=uncultured Propionibacteriaceae bacterium TaxID=257457 RepID=A0A6J4N8H9_9ACTN|nr:MAG: hypothetical protein AVDCRST_MAG75-530 [uncultured Propionibacteriaceae bacterium]
MSDIDSRLSDRRFFPLFSLSELAVVQVPGELVVTQLSCRCDYRTRGRTRPWMTGPSSRRAQEERVATTLGKVAQHAESNSRNNATLPSSARSVAG